MHQMKSSNLYNDIDNYVLIGTLVRTLIPIVGSVICQLCTSFYSHATFEIIWSEPYLTQINSTNSKWPIFSWIKRFIRM